MTTARMRAVLIMVGMVLLFLGVVAGAAVGTFLRTESLAVGETTLAGEQETQLEGRATNVLKVTQRGGGPAIRVESIGGPGLFAESWDRDRTAVYARNGGPSRGSGAAITADGGSNVGIRGRSQEFIGIWASGPDVALYADADAVIGADLYVDGTCTGCALALLAINGSDRVLTPGEAVTVAGLTQSGGDSVVTVVPADRGTTMLGVVTTSLTPGRYRLDERDDVRFFGESGGSVPPGGLMRVVTFGPVEEIPIQDDTANPIQPGDRLTVATTTAMLAKAEPGTPADQTIGFALEPSQGGMLSVFITAR